MKINKFGSSTTGLGDILLLTSICKYFPKQLTIQLQKSINRFSILFENLANIEITDNVNIIPDVGYDHYATTKLRNFFDKAEYFDNRPLVLYSDIESELWANDFLKKIKNPVIFVPHCAKHWHNTRSIPTSKIKEIYNEFIKRDFTPIIIQSSSNKVQEIGNSITLTDLELRKYICLLRKCGFYCGCNTGDMHLAISVGCLVRVFEPFDDMHFQSFRWKYNHPTIKYLNFQ